MGAEKLLAQRYDVVATTLPARTADDLRNMVRNLLVDRFALRAHQESRELPVYYLTMSRPDRRLGPNLLPLKFDCEKEKEPEHTCSTTLGSVTQIIESGRDWNVIGLARRLSGPAGRIVVDKTGLTGPFDIRLEWSPADVDRDSALGQNVSLFTALQEQLGLKLEPASAQVPLLVVDDIKEATEN